MGIAKFFLIPSSGVLVVPVSLMSLNTELDDEIVLATYQSYISSDIADEAFNDYSLKTIYFENDKEVFNGFASGAFDLAILSSSTLEEAITKGLAKKIDWNRFTSIKSKLGENGASAAGGGSSTADLNKKLANIYSPVVSKFFTNAPQLAEYGIPYFISYLAFAYRGKKELGQGSSGATQVTATTTETTTQSPQNPISWHDLMQKISKDERFKSKNGEPKLGMVEDELTLFSLSKLSNSNNSSSVEELFKQETKTSEDDFYKQYMKINSAGITKEGLGERPLFFSPDSVVLSNALCSKKLEGIFFYNGDALYAHQMLQDDECEGEELSDSDSADSSDSSESSEDKTIHVVPLSPALWFMDSIVISSKSSKAKEERIYKFLEKLSFEHFDKLTNLNRQKELKEDEGEEKEDKPEWLLGNFKEIGYTPTLKDFNQWIKGKHQSPPPPPPPKDDENFYKKEKEFLYGDPDMEQCLETPQNTSAGANTGKCSVVFERGLNDSQNLNLALAFERWKNHF